MSYVPVTIISYKCLNLNFVRVIINLKGRNVVLQIIKMFNSGSSTILNEKVLHTVFHFEAIKGVRTLTSCHFSKFIWAFVDLIKLTGLASQGSELHYADEIR